MKIECTPEELKKLIKNEQTESKSACPTINIEFNCEKVANEMIKSLANYGKH